MFVGVCGGECVATEIVFVGVCGGECVATEIVFVGGVAVGVCVWV